jgi:hypothetical protein
MFLFFCWFVFIYSFCHLVRLRLGVLSSPIRDAILGFGRVCATRNLSIRGPRLLPARKISTTTCCFNICQRQISGARLSGWPNLVRYLSIIIHVALCLVVRIIFHCHLPFTSAGTWDLSYVVILPESHYLWNRRWQQV